MSPNGATPRTSPRYPSRRRRGRIGALLALNALATLLLAAVLLRGGPAGLPLASAPPPTATVPGPTPTFTLTPMQIGAAAGALLAEGLSSQAQGDYEAAVTAYQALLARYPQAEAAPEAAFRLGECQLLRGENTLARDAFARAVRDYPSAPRAPEAGFLGGLAGLRLGDSQSAIVAYRQYGVLRPQVQGYMSLLVGGLLRQQGSLTQALAAYQQAAGADLPQSEAVDALLAVAEVQAALKDAAQAAATYQQVLALARTGWYRSLALYRLGILYRDGKEPAKARASLLQVVNDYPDSSLAVPALEALDAMGGNEGLGGFQRGLVQFYAGSYAQAIAAWRAYIDATPLSEGTGLAHYYIGLAYRRQGEHRLAGLEFDTLIRLYPKGSLLADARVAKARSLQLAGDEASAAAEYLTAARFYPGTPQAERGLWDGGLSLYRLGDAAGAAAAWSQLAADFPKATSRARNLYWLAKALSAVGRRPEAQRYLTEAAGQSSPGYYSLRAAGLEAKNTVTATQQSLCAERPGDRPALAAWIAGWAGAAPPREGARERLLADPHFGRGQALVAIHQWESAVDEFNLAQEALARDPWALLEMADALAALGQNQHAIAAAQRLLAASPATALAAAPAAMQRLVYPVPYCSLLETEAKRRGLDPAWLLSLVRQESLFFASASSWAEARGLTQVIPSTGRMIAERLGTPAFRLEDLFRPRLSLQFGAYYLGEMVRLTQGDIWMALASYNGGYTNARAWAGGDRPSDPDLFLENITYDETQTYLRLLFQGYATYRRLYADSP